jgi:hypothetical protein
VKQLLTVLAWQKSASTGFSPLLADVLLSGACPNTTDGMGQGSMIVNIFGIKRMVGRRGKLHYVFFCIYIVRDA